MKLTNLLVVLLLLAGGEIVAQPACRATLPAVPGDGYYAIDLPYVIRGYAQPDLADLRIIDNDGREIAWAQREDTERRYAGGFRPFPVEVLSAGKTTQLLVNAAGESLSSLTLRMKNAEVRKQMTLEGSNDRQHWFVVREHIGLVNATNPVLTEAFVQVDFPLSDYHYYKIAINDSLSAPLNITEVGVMKEGYTYVSQLLELPVKDLTIRTEGKQTYVNVVLPYKIEVADVEFYISAPAHYERRMKGWLPERYRSLEGRTLLGKRTYVDQQDWDMYTLSSDNGRPSILPFNHYTDTLRMEIDNKDDQPLHIDSVKAYVRKVYLVAALQAEKTYSLTCGDEAATYPQYDLSFARQLPDSLTHLTPVNIEVSPTVVSAAERTGWNEVMHYGLWVVIIAVIMQIIFVVRKLLKQKP